MDCRPEMFLSILLRYTSEIICDSDSGAGQHKVPLGSFACHLKVKSKNRMGLSLIHCAAKPSKFTKVQQTCLTPAYATKTQHMFVPTCYTVRYRGDIYLLIWYRLA